MTIAPQKQTVFGKINALLENSDFFGTRPACRRRAQP